MALRYWTLLVFGLSLLVCVAYDSWIASVDDNATLSAITAHWALRHTISVFCVGLVLGTIIGHLFWYQIPRP